MRNRKNQKLPWDRSAAFEIYSYYMSAWALKNYMYLYNPEASLMMYSYLLLHEIREL